MCSQGNIIKVEDMENPINLYNAVKLLFGEENGENAAKAFQLMNKTGWKMWTYDDWGQNVYVPSDWDEKPSQFPSDWRV